MALAFYYGSGSPFAWRVWLALEHKNIAYELKTMSFSAGDLKTPQYRAINPRGKVPAIVDDGFALYESAAIVEYLEDRYRANGQPLFPGDAGQRALVRRIIAESDNYLVEANERLVALVLFTRREAWNEQAIAEARDDLGEELDRFDAMATADWMAGPLSAADHAIYPVIALALRMEKRKPDLAISTRIGPRLKAWMQRFEALPCFDKTYPPHWKAA
jgi:glutathione S-transferase